MLNAFFSLPEINPSMIMKHSLLIFVALLGSATLPMPAYAAPAKPARTKAPKPPAAPPLPLPPTLPGGATIVTDTSADFLKAPDGLAADVDIAKAAPTVDFGWFPGQTYPAEIWSVWGNSICANGKYYASLGDHMSVHKETPGSPGHHGTAYVYEYDPKAKTFRLLLNTSELLKLPETDYSPGKIHSRLDMGSDGWLYCSTHNGSLKGTTDQYHHEGDWILRCNPATGKSEVVARTPVPKHSIPNGVLDGKRMIFYGGTAAGDNAGSGPDDTILFFAYDVARHKLLYAGKNGPARGIILSSSTGRVYYTPKMALSPIMRYDPATPGEPPKEIPGEIGNRTATFETPQGMVFTASQARAGKDKKVVEPAFLYSFNTKTEKIEKLAPTSIGSPGPDYVAAMAADPTGRYVYYTVGAHGGSESVGSALVQFDTQLKRKKVVAFLTPFITEKYRATPTGSFSLAVDEKGETVFITWNTKREGSPVRSWDAVSLTVVHIPASERETK